VNGVFLSNFNDWKIGEEKIKTGFNEFKNTPYSE